MKAVAMLVALVTVACGIALAQGAAPKQPWYDTITVSGYFQARAHARDYDSVTNEREEFYIRRLYINLGVRLNAQTEASIMWSGVGPDFQSQSNAGWANIYVDYMPTPEWRLRIGQGPTFFGIDDSESSTVRLTPERAMAMEGNSILGLRGLWWQGPWDRGVWAIYDNRPTPNGRGWRGVLGILNGQFRSAEADNNKTIEVDATYFDDWGQAGIGFINGTWTGDPDGGGPLASASYDRSVVGLNARYFVNPTWAVQAEFLTGEFLSNDVDGWYLQASHVIGPEATHANWQQLAYVRYEEYDPDTDVADNTYRGLHLGYKYRLAPMDELTLEYTLGELGSYDANDLIFQYQKKF